MLTAKLATPAFTAGDLLLLRAIRVETLDTKDLTIDGESPPDLPRTLCLINCSVAIQSSTTSLNIRDNVRFRVDSEDSPDSPEGVPDVPNITNLSDTTELFTEIVAVLNDRYNQSIVLELEAGNIVVVQ